MKKVLFIALAVLALSSCAKPDKCKCEVKVLNITAEDVIIERPEDKKCSQIKVEDIKGEIISIDLNKIGTIDCVNYQE